jgi:hypothetical protein
MSGKTDARHGKSLSVGMVRRSGIRGIVPVDVVALTCPMRGAMMLFLLTTVPCAAFLVCPLGEPASGTTPDEKVVLYFDASVPQVAFAAGDIRAALEAKGFSVDSHALAALGEGSRGKRIILAPATEARVGALMAAQGAKAPPSLGEQAYCLRTTGAPQKSYWVLGGDANGVMYGGLQVAEYLRFQGFEAVCDEQDAPYLKRRGVKFNIPLDRNSPTYFYNSQGTSHREAIRHVWDLGFWTAWFDEMARHRYNVLSLWSPHPFTAMLKMADYPDVAIQGVEGYGPDGKSAPVNAMTIDDKIAFWRKVMKYGRDRGFEIYFCTWNIFLSTAEGKYGLTTSPHDKQTRTYLRKCMTQFLETYPDLAGFGITVGENMGGIDNKEKEAWAWDTYGRGMMDYATAHPERKLVFIHRQHQGNLVDMLEVFAPLGKLPNVRLDLSFKYSQAHAHAAVKPGYWDRKKTAEGLDRHGLKSWLTVRNDDFYFLHWADPQFVRDYVLNFPEVGKYVDAFYIGADGWVFTREFASKNPYYSSRNALSIQKTWYMQKLWGRISYNPSVPDDLFKRHLAQRHPDVSAERLFQAWSHASRAVQKANEQVTGSWSLDFDWWPEGWSSKEGFRTLDETREARPMRGSKLCDFKETSRGVDGDKVSALANADAIESLAGDALAILPTLEPGEDAELRLTLKDLEALAHLALYSAHKFRAAVYAEQRRQEEARDCMGRAYGHWERYTAIMSGLYRAVDLQRNRGFRDWQASNDEALNDFTRLGGRGRPGLPK